jgi:hypothetical protein
MKSNACAKRNPGTTTTSANEGISIKPVSCPFTSPNKGDPSARSSSASGALQATEGVYANRAAAAGKDRGEDYLQEAWRSTGVIL